MLHKTTVEENAASMKVLEDLKVVLKKFNYTSDPIVLVNELERDKKAPLEVAKCMRKFFLLFYHILKFILLFKFNFYYFFLFLFSKFIFVI